MGIDQTSGVLTTTKVIEATARIKTENIRQAKDPWNAVTIIIKFFDAQGKK